MAVVSTTLIQPSSATPSGPPAASSSASLSSRAASDVAPRAGSLFGNSIVFFVVLPTARVAARLLVLVVAVSLVPGLVAVLGSSLVGPSVQFVAVSGTSTLGSLLVVPSVAVVLVVGSASILGALARGLVVTPISGTLVALAVLVPFPFIVFLLVLVAFFLISRLVV